MNHSTPYGLIYKITDSNKKVYIGQTTKIFDDNYFGSGTIIRNIIKKHGKKNLKKEILGYCFSKEELDECEKECIDFFDSRNRIYGYNLKTGGSYGKHHEETKIKLSINHADTKLDKNAMFGVSPLQRMINKYGEHEGTLRYEQWKVNIGKTVSGKVTSEETKIKMRIAYQNRKKQS